MRWHPNVLIVGAGPAGMFAAQELARQGVKDVMVIDSGREADLRDCPLTSACNCTPCEVLEGFGGSGGVSDGKMTFALDRGTQLESVFRPEHEELLGYVDQTMVDLGIEGVRYEPDQGRTPPGFERSQIAFTTYPLWHVGSDGIQRFSQRFTESLEQQGIEMRKRVRAKRLIFTETNDAVLGVEAKANLGPGEYADVKITANHVILAVGIFGMGWLEHELTLAGFEFSTGPAGIGVRIETPNQVMDPLFDAFYDWKAVGEFSGITMRSFCCNRDGHIMPEYHKHLEIRNVNGHSYLDPERRSASSNFSLQAKITTDDHPDPQAFVRAVARSMNDLSGGWQVRQPVSVFLGMSEASIASEDSVTYPQARIADVRAAFPRRLYQAFSEYLIALDRAIPGIIASGWLYGPEVKYHARKLPVERSDWTLQGMRDTYVIGDSTGLTGSYVSAAMTGIIAARGIAQRQKR